MPGINYCSMVRSFFFVRSKGIKILGRPKGCPCHTRSLGTRHSHSLVTIAVVTREKIFHGLSVHEAAVPLGINFGLMDKDIGHVFLVGQNKAKPFESVEPFHCTRVNCCCIVVVVVVVLLIIVCCG